jgi:hypothetical protein
MFYVIEKRDSEWIVLAHGVAILRCADADMALEIVQIAQEQLRATDGALAAVPAPPVAPEPDEENMQQPVRRRTVLPRA